MSQNADGVASNMRVIVGSANQVKIDAVSEILKEYPDFANAVVSGVAVSSDVSDQPLTLDETIQGAMNRARNAFKDCDYSVGIEGGLARIPFTKTDYMNIEACAIYDGIEMHIGLSPGFEYPREVIAAVLAHKINISEAFYRTGLVNAPALGQREGGVGFLTNGRMVRKTYTTYAVMMALIHLENKQLFSKTAPPSEGPLQP